MSQSTRRFPRPASCSAQARPMPRAAPVIKAQPSPVTPGKYPGPPPRTNGGPAVSPLPRPRQTERMHPTQDARVILRLCDDYDPVRIQEIVGDALDELGLVPRGRVLVK